MVQPTILPDDPRLTAYALDEMAPAERVEFEEFLQQDAAARRAVAEIRATVAALTRALVSEAEPVAAKPDLAHAAIVPGHDPRRLDGGLVPIEGLLNKRIKFPTFYYVVSGLAAACFAVFFVYWDKSRPTHERKTYMAVPLVAAKGEAVSESAAVNLPVAEGNADEGDKTLASVSPQSAAPAQAGSLLAGGSVGGRVGNQLAKLKTGFSLSESEFNTEAYAFRKDNDYLRVADQPLSTFSVDVDTASYANVRRFILQGQRPPADAVRVEEMVNYFPYDYAGPKSEVGDVLSVGGSSATRGGGTPSTGENRMTTGESKLTAGAANPPFAAHLEVASAPWAPEHRLVRIGLKGREVSDAARPAANLVFLLDVSGSMDEPNKLPLVKQSLRLLVGKLRPDDRVAIAVYAGASGLVLPSTAVAHKAEIFEAIDRLQAEGSTNGALGIQLAYDIAKANFIAGGVNRVILATDGDFNVGVTSEGGLVRLIEEKAKSGVFLSVLGFGMGNLKDGTLEQLADKGNGNYAYIDSLAEAKKALVEQAGGTLVTIAKDVKLQVEFNPAVVQAYRLIGYENRLLAKEDFNNDKIDAGEIGAGHTVTALYEIVPVGVEMPKDIPAVDGLKYQLSVNPISQSGRDLAGSTAMQTKIKSPKSEEMLTVKIRYKEPAGEVSSKLEFPLFDRGGRFEDATPDFKFAAAVVAFGMVLRDSPHKGSAKIADITAWGRAGIVSDVGGYRHEFLGLVERSEALLR